MLLAGELAELAARLALAIHRLASSAALFHKNFSGLQLTDIQP